MTSKEAQSLTPFSSADIADALHALGLDGYIPNIASLSPQNGARKIIGKAHTTQFLPIAESQNVAEEKSVQFVDALPSIDEQPETIIVVATDLTKPGCSIRNAVWGGLMTTRAMKLGAKGVIVEGYIRDLEEQHEMDFPVYASGLTSVSKNYGSSFGWGIKCVSVGKDIVIHKVTIKNGDWIIADSDGIVRVPEEKLDQVVSIAKKNQEMDALIMSKIRDENWSLKEALALRTKK